MWMSDIENVINTGMYVPCKKSHGEAASSTLSIAGLNFEILEKVVT